MAVSLQPSAFSPRMKNAFRADCVPVFSPKAEG